MLFSFLLLVTVSCIGQSSHTSVSYFGPYAFEPGIKLAHSFALKTIDREKRDFTWYLEPAAGYYAKRNFHRVVVLNLESGISFLDKAYKSYHTFGIGAGYLFRSEVMGLIVDFNGDILAKEREGRQYIQAFASYSYNHRIIESLDGFAKVSGGYLFGVRRANAGIAFVELGIRYKLNGTKE